jgi:hypothetical protein
MRTTPGATPFFCRYSFAHARRSLMGSDEPVFDHSVFAVAVIVLSRLKLTVSPGREGSRWR